MTAAGCVSRFVPPSPPERLDPGEWLEVEATGYCACGQCCNWRRTWWGRPVIAAGPSRGRSKAVGITSSGARARRGTVAADISVLPYGTILDVPGYGWGIVEDAGGAIRGHHIDLYFERHSEALAWGRRRLRVRCWRPPAEAVRR